MKVFTDFLLIVSNLQKTSIFSKYIDNLSMASFSKTKMYENKFMEGRNANDNIFLKADAAKDNTLDFQKLIPFLDHIQKGIIVHNRKSLKTKVSVLEKLRDHLLFNIQDRITNLWIDKPQAEARTYKDDEEDYYLESSSQEGPLMTIAFLAFAVFLIKLVMKLITALKYKNKYFATQPATTTAANLIFGRRKRAIDEELSKILPYLDQFKYNG